MHCAVQTTEEHVRLVPLSLSLPLPLCTNVIQNVFSKRYSHTQLTCEEARQGKEMIEEERRGGQGRGRRHQRR